MLRPVSNTRSSQARGPRSNRKRASKRAPSSSEDEGTRKILRERARKLAKPMEKETAEKLSIGVVVLQIGQERLAIETRFVLAALSAPPVVRLPRAAAHVEGLSLVRSQLLPVFDLLELLELRSDGAEGRSLLAVLGIDQPEFGVSVDEVLPTSTIPIDHLREFEAGDAESKFVRGMTNDGVTVLDGQSLLNHPALFLGDPVR